jgi:hypothetical protein
VIRVAVICGMVSYALMNLVMTSAPARHRGLRLHHGHAADTLSAHVLAMFVPSFFTGHLIARFGRAADHRAGLALLASRGWWGCRAWRSASSTGR